MRSPARRATSADVARAAGVSRTTVSFVLNNKPGQSIPEETRRRVLEAARSLDYRPHASARSLAAGRSDVVLLSISQLPIPANISRFAEECATTLAERGLTMVLHLDVQGRPLADVCASVDASAVVAMGDLPPETTAALRRTGVAVVLSVGGDSAAAHRDVGRLQAEHLIERGHRRLGYALAGQRVPRAMASEQLLGVEEACAAVGAEPPTVLSVAPRPADAARAVALWRDRSVTAVAAYNDETALAVLAGMRELGLTAPDDLAVIGADDIRAASLVTPPLTTVAFDLSNAARHLAEVVASALAGGEARPAEVSSGPRVVRRESA
ncbi:LacI family DNA-binding transcriptional regulator [Marinactinospora rubrisoli]|uniref:LacI family DNA-binding transcriptional regulator n=1 Tax=Marinactinospora rubrisoli TaxID=2715399 RepID=A0ABW2KIA5_9ACTN